MIQLFYWYAAKTTCRTSIILWGRSFGIFKGIKKQFGTWSFEQKLSLIWIAIKSTVDAINATVALIFRLNRLHTIIQFNKRNKCAMHTSQVVQSLLTHLNNVYGIKQFNFNFIYQTRLALASTLWPFIFAEIHSTHPISAYVFLLSPTLGFPPRFIDALVGVTGISVRICDALHITSLDFLLFSHLHVRSRNALPKITKYIVRKISGYSLKWVYRLSRLNFTRETWQFSCSD